MVRWGQDILEKEKGNSNRRQLEAILVDVSINERRMGRLNRNTWWHSPIEYASTNVEFHCDPKFGLPKAGDCMNVEFQISGRYSLAVSPF